MARSTRVLLALLAATACTAGAAAPGPAPPAQPPSALPPAAAAAAPGAPPMAPAAQRAKASGGPAPPSDVMAQRTARSGGTPVICISPQPAQVVCSTDDPAVEPSGYQASGPGGAWGRVSGPLGARGAWLLGACRRGEPGGVCLGRGRPPSGQGAWEETPHAAPPRAAGRAACQVDLFRRLVELSNVGLHDGGYAWRCMEWSPMIEDLAAPNGTCYMAAGVDILTEYLDQGIRFSYPTLPQGAAPPLTPDLSPMPSREPGQQQSTLTHPVLGFMHSHAPNPRPEDPHPWNLGRPRHVVRPSG
jgi:hypothetical protein